MKYLLTPILLSLFIYQITAGILPSSCGLASNAMTLPTINSDLHSGAFDFLPPTIPSRYLEYNISYPFKISMGQKYQVALSLIYIENYYDSDGLDFSIRPVIEDSQFRALVVLSESSIWTKIHAHYFVSGREDLRVGTFSWSPVQLLKASESPRNISVKYALENPWSLSNSLISFQTFLVGIKTKDTYINFDILENTSQFIANTLNFKVLVSSQTAPIEYITFSYILYTFYNSAISISPIINPLAELQKQLLEIPTVSLFSTSFIGMSQIHAQNIKINFQYNAPSENITQVNATRRLQEILRSPQLKNQVQLFYNSFMLVGLSFSNEAFLPTMTIVKNMKSALNLNSGSSVIDSVQCFTVNECEALGGISVLNSTNGRTCIVCEINEMFDSELNMCVCQVGLVKNSQGFCVLQSTLCDAGSVFFNGSCFTLVESNSICQQNQYFNSTIQACVCKQGYSSQSFPLQCIPICSSAQTYNPTTQLCQCSTYIDSNGECFACDFLTEIYDIGSNNCICADRTMNVNGVCQKCSTNSNFNFKTRACVCKRGYVGDGINCKISLKILNFNSPTVGV